MIKLAILFLGSTLWILSTASAETTIELPRCQEIGRLVGDERSSPSVMFWNSRTTKKLGKYTREWTDNDFATLKKYAEDCLSPTNIKDKKRDRPLTKKEYNALVVSIDKAEKFSQEARRFWLIRQKIPRRFGGRGEPFSGGTLEEMLKEAEPHESELRSALSYLSNLIEKSEGLQRSYAQDHFNTLSTLEKVYIKEKRRFVEHVRSRRNQDKYSTEVKKVTEALEKMTAEVESLQDDPDYLPVIDTIEKKAGNMVRALKEEYPVSSQWGDYGSVNHQYRESVKKLAKALDRKAGSITSAIMSHKINKKTIDVLEKEIARVESLPDTSETLSELGDPREAGNEIIDTAWSKVNEKITAIRKDLGREARWIQWIKIDLSPSERKADELEEVIGKKRASIWHKIDLAKCAPKMGSTGLPTDVRKKNILLQITGAIIDFETLFCKSLNLGNTVKYFHPLFGTNHGIEITNDLTEIDIVFGKLPSGILNRDLWVIKKAVVDGKALTRTETESLLLRVYIAADFVNVNPEAP